MGLIGPGRRRDGHIYFPIQRGDVFEGTLHSTPRTPVLPLVFLLLLLLLLLGIYRVLCSILQSKRRPNNYSTIHCKRIRRVLNLESYKLLDLPQDLDHSLVLGK